MTRDRASGSALLVLALGAAWESRRLRLGTHHGPGPGHFIVARGRAAPPLATLEWGEAPQAVAVMAGAAFATLALERLGYRLTVLGVLAFLLGAVERRRPGWSGSSRGRWPSARSRSSRCDHRDFKALAEGVPRVGRVE